MFKTLPGRHVSSILILSVAIQDSTAMMTHEKPCFCLCKRWGKQTLHKTPQAFKADLEDKIYLPCYSGSQIAKGARCPGRWQTHRRSSGVKRVRTTCSSQGRLPEHQHEAGRSWATVRAKWWTGHAPTSWSATCLNLPWLLATNYSRCCISSRFPITEFLLDKRLAIRANTPSLSQMHSHFKRARWNTWWSEWWTLRHWTDNERFLSKQRNLSITMHIMHYWWSATLSSCKADSGIHFPCVAYGKNIYSRNPLSDCIRVLQGIRTDREAGREGVCVCVYLFIMRNWLTQLWRPRSSKICRGVYAGGPG